MADQKYLQPKISIHLGGALEAEHAAAGGEELVGDGEVEGEAGVAGEGPLSGRRHPRLGAGHRVHVSEQISRYLCLDIYKYLHYLHGPGDGVLPGHGPRVRGVAVDVPGQDRGRAAVNIFNIYAIDMLDK